MSTVQIAGRGQVGSHTETGRVSASMHTCAHGMIWSYQKNSSFGPPSLSPKKDQQRFLLLDPLRKFSGPVATKASS